MNRQRENIPVHYAAETYDRFTDAFLGRFDRLLADRLQHEFRTRPLARRVLDAGCGTSRFLLRLAALPPLKPLTFIGLDYYADMIQISRKNVLREDLLNRILLVTGDVHQLPFSSASFDFVISRSTLHHWADPATGLVEIRRVLAPGGVALVHEIRRDPSPEALAAFNRFRQAAGVEQSRLEEKYSLEEIRALVAVAGLNQETMILAPARGYSSLGCEVRIEAPASEPPRGRTG